MRKLVIIIFWLFAITFFNSNADEFRIMSYNIRYDAKEDYAIDCGWENRKENLLKLIKFHKADIIGIQEALIHQLVYIDSSLIGYSRIGVGRDDGKNKGEYSAIYYNNYKFQVIESGNFWLSETPDIAGSIGWDAAITRIVSWAKFKANSDGNEYLVFNTHFDHKGLKAREESAKLLINKIQDIRNQYRKHNDKLLPVIITGDFNTQPGTEPYLIINDKFKDAFEVSKNGNYGSDGSGWGFIVCEVKEHKRIDFIFLSDDFIVLNHAILTDSFNGKYPSDHLPIITTITPN